jgi:hypothetical protein
MKTPEEKAAQTKLAKRNFKILLGILAAVAVSMIIADKIYPTHPNISNPPQTLEDKIESHQEDYQRRHQENYRKLYGE